MFSKINQCASTYIIECNQLSGLYLSRLEFETPVIG